MCLKDMQEEFNNQSIIRETKHTEYECFIVSCQRLVMDFDLCHIKPVSLPSCETVPLSLCDSSVLKAAHLHSVPAHAVREMWVNSCLQMSTDFDTWITLSDCAHTDKYNPLSSTDHKPSAYKIIYSDKKTSQSVILCWFRVRVSNILTQTVF